MWQLRNIHTDQVLCLVRTYILAKDARMRAEEVYYPQTVVAERLPDGR